jgi:hypothetical protein
VNRSTHFSVLTAQRKRLAAGVNCLMAATHFLPLFLTRFHDEEVGPREVD